MTGQAAADAAGPGAGDHPDAAHPDAAHPAPVARPARRSMAVALLLAAAGSAVTLGVAGQVWARARAANQFGSAVEITATGKDVNGAVTALALVGLASVVGVLATRRFGRLLVGAVMALAGVGIAVVAVLGAGDTSALHDAAEAAGDGTMTAVHHTAWPWVTLPAGLLLAAGGVLTVWRGRAWPGMSRKYDAPTGAGRAAPRRPTAPADIWKALDRGEDPTAE